jgi:hypothetical protein
MRLQGYLGLGFPTSPGKMVPGDAVIATIDDKTATTKVRCAEHMRTLKPAVQLPLACTKLRPQML